MTIGERTGTVVAVDQVLVDATDRVTLLGLTMTVIGHSEPVATVARAVITVDRAALVSRRLRLVLLALEAPTLAVTLLPHGATNLDTVIAKTRAWLGRDRGSGDREGDAPSTLDRHVPRVTWSAGRVQVIDTTQQLASLGVPGLGSGTVEAVEGSLENGALLSDQLELTLKARGVLRELAGQVDVTASSGSASPTMDASVVLTPQATGSTAPGELSIRWREMEAHAARISWRRGTGLRVSQLRVSDLEGPSSASSSSGAAEWLRVGTLSLSRTHDAAGGARWAVRVERPMLASRAVATRLLSGAEAPAPPTQSAPVAAEPDEDPTGLDPRSEPTGHGEVVRAALRAVATRLSEAAERLATRVQGGLARVPPVQLEIVDGRIEGDGPNDALTVTGRIDRPVDPAALATASVTLGAGLGTVTVDVRIEPTAGELQLGLTGNGLRLGALGPWLPAPLDPATVLGETRLSLLLHPSAKRAVLTGAVRLAGLTLHWPSLALEPLHGVALSADLDARWDGVASQLVVSKLTARAFDAAVELELTARELNAVPKLALDLRVPLLEVATVTAALPRPLVGALEGTVVHGRIGWSLKATLDTADMSSLEYTSTPITDPARPFSVEKLGPGARLGKLRGRFLHRAKASDGRVTTFETGPGSPGWVPLSEVSPYVAKVLTTTEDATFTRHAGIAFFAVKNAIVRNLQTGRFARGASTLTQQLVKNLFLGTEKTLARKAQELFLAWQIEQRLSKDELLALYLNVVELGPGLYGIGKATRTFFGKSPKELDLIEAAYVGSILPAPRRFFRFYKSGAISAGWREVLKKTLEIMVQRGTISRAEFEAAAPYAPTFRTRP